VDVLILGRSSIVERRVLSALRGIKGVGRIDVGSRGRAAAGPWPYGELYPDYDAALRWSEAPIVYVSQVNSEHEHWTRVALQSGRHVVVDKPAFLSPGIADEMLELAAGRNLCLAEATVFGYHPQITALKELFAEEPEGTPTRVTAWLSFPPFQGPNFRYRAELGGGALWDVGPYAAAAGRVLFGEQPSSVSCEVLARSQIDTAFSLLATFSGGRSLVGHFGFDTAYCNRLHTLSASLSAELDRAFTTVPDADNRIRVTRQSGGTELEVPRADAFGEFLRQVLGAINAGEWTRFADDLCTDARTLDQIRRAAGVN